LIIKLFIKIKNYIQINNIKKYNLRFLFKNLKEYFRPREVKTFQKFQIDLFNFQFDQIFNIINFNNKFIKLNNKFLLLINKI
jgi:hypothetical protein